MTDDGKVLCRSCWFGRVSVSVCVRQSISFIVSDMAVSGIMQQYGCLIAGCCFLAAVGVYFMLVGSYSILVFCVPVSEQNGCLL